MNSEINNHLALSPLTPVKTDTGSQSSSSKQSATSNPVNLSQGNTNINSNKLPSLSSIKSAAAQSNPLLQASNLSVEYSVDKSSKEVVIKVVDSSGKVVRQIPSTEMLDFVKRLQDMEAQQKGAVIQTRA